MRITNCLDNLQVLGVDLAIDAETDLLHNRDIVLHVCMSPVRPYFLARRENGPYEEDFGAPLCLREAIWAIIYPTRSVFDEEMARKST